MIRVALRGLLGRKLRAILTALAIILGVAMMSGAYVLTDTIDKAFDSILTQSYAGTDAVVTGKDPGFGFEGESRSTPHRRAVSRASRLRRPRSRRRRLSAYELSTASSSRRELSRTTRLSS